MPPKVDVNARAIVIAGFAKIVDLVNHYPAQIYTPTALGITSFLSAYIHPIMVHNSPKTATVSDTNSPRLSLCGPLNEYNSCTLNMTCARAVPKMPPKIWQGRYASSCRVLISPLKKNAKLTTVLKCAPDTGPNMWISTNRIPAVAAVMPKSATPSSADNVSPMIPEPTMAADKIHVPTNSAMIWRS